MKDEEKRTADEGIEAWLDRWFYDRDSRLAQAEEPPVDRADCLELRRLG